MKIEVGSFTVSGGTFTTYFDDDTLTAKSIIFVSGKDSTTGTNLSIGATDGIKERSLSSLYDTSKKNDFDATYSVLHYLNVSGTATRKVALRDIDLSTAGQFSGVADSYDVTVPIMFIAIGE